MEGVGDGVWDAARLCRLLLAPKSHSVSTGTRGPRGLEHFPTRDAARLLRRRRRGPREPKPVVRFSQRHVNYLVHSMLLEDGCSSEEAKGALASASTKKIRHGGMKSAPE